jgi:hypothetical protein
MLPLPGPSADSGKRIVVAWFDELGYAMSG